MSEAPVTILGLAIPPGQKLWFWNAGGEAGLLLFAKDYDEAYAKCIAERVDGTDPDALADARRWFVKNDTLEEVVGEVTCQPYAGALPDDYEGE